MIGAGGVPGWWAAWIGLYTVLALSHLLIQITLGHVAWRRSRRWWRSTGLDFTPPVTVLIPCYNEADEVLGDCLASVAAQDYPRLQVLLIDDGSLDTALFRSLAEDWQHHPHVEFLALPDNVGKRAAQVAALPRATGEVIVTVDSDTILRDEQCLRRLVSRLADPEVGVVTGDVRPANREDNLLTRLTSARYWMAFHQERAAQSVFGVMLCASGPLAAYRAEVFHAVAGRYVGQRFLGRTCTFGDDRHMTNLFLWHGYRSVFEPTARAYTFVPHRLRMFLRQQLRWNRSFYREALWSLRLVHRRHPYLAYDLALHLVLPFLLLGCLGLTAYQAAAGDPAVAGRYVAVCLTIGLLRAAYGLLRERDPQFVIFPLYGFLHVGLLLPTRLVALFTLRGTGWGTRARKQTTKRGQHRLGAGQEASSVSG